MTRATTDAPGVIVLPPFLFGGAFLAGTLLQLLLPMPLVAGRRPWIPGLILSVVAVVLAISARRQFTRAGTNVNPMEPATAIVTGGPYRFTRNPMYLGMTILTIGGALMMNSRWPLMTLVPTLLIAEFGIIRREERYLEAKFGDTYRAYRSRVRRWI